ncbi:MAG: CDP-diacylglycerol--glycerol-3-phosphate 3-phosphatidyltransferase [Clostridia bacterium]|nr:CDP-diacylglycerol--glycerol-3-phosphate 3-phosphatidyltransferase [Clostridia bacterium]
MNIPNKLTVARAVATPVFMAVMIFRIIPFNYTAALIIFILASLTDLLDGKIARKRNLVTAFGKFLDPVADKMLTTAALLGFMIIMPSGNYTLQVTLITFITLFREFVVSSVRLIAVSGDTKKVIAANMWGKLKTVAQMASIILGLLAYSVKDFTSGADGLFSLLLVVFLVTAWISVFFTVVSGVIYLYQSRNLIDSSK